MFASIQWLQEFLNTSHCLSVTAHIRGEDTVRLKTITSFFFPRLRQISASVYNAEHVNMSESQCGCFSSTLYIQQPFYANICQRRAIYVDIWLQFNKHAHSCDLQNHLSIQTHAVHLLHKDKWDDTQNCLARIHSALQASKITHTETLT